MITAPPGYLRRLRELCTRHNVLLIADEVATGFGRTGAMFACEREGVTPALMTGTQAAYDALLGEYADFRTFFHGHSYTGNALACAAALANLDVFVHERVIEGLAAKVAHLQKALPPAHHHPK